MHKVLILGGSGLVGTAIMREMNKYKKFQPYATHFKNPISLGEGESFKLSLEGLDDISLILNTLKPQSVVSCLRGDFNKQLILHMKVAEYLKEKGGSLYFFSTTNVFDNDLSRPHDEDDLTSSQTDYGQYKIECENKMIELLHDNVCILRIPQVWGKNSPRMIELLKSLHDNKDIVVYPKLFYNTITDVMIARQLCYIMDNNLKGKFHLTAEDVVNYRDFYNELITGLGFNNARLEENFENEGYLALLTKRSNEFPEELRLTNKSVISYLIS